MTDEQISEIASPFLEWTEQGYAIIDKAGFARALLSASIADTAKPVARVVYSRDVDGDCYARAAWLDETVIEDGALLYLAAPPAPSVADKVAALNAPDNKESK